MAGDNRPISAWRAQALVRIAELRHEMELLRAGVGTPSASAAAAAVEPDAAERHSTGAVAAERHSTGPVRIAADTARAAAANAVAAEMVVAEAGAIVESTAAAARAELCQAFVGERLDAAAAAASRTHWQTRFAVGLTGRDVEVVWRNIHAAEAELLRIIPAIDVGSGHDLAGQSAEIDSTVEMYLPATDSRRIELHRRYVTGKTLTDKDRESAARAIRAALREYDDQRSRVRSFRNVLLVVSAVMMGAVAAIAVATAARPTVLSLCFGTSCPTGNDTPTSFDVILVELLGAAAALLVGAMSLARVRGTSTPYAVPVVAALFKVPTGALTAVFGLLLIRGQFAPGITLTGTPEIVAWALLFGAAQQSFTMLIDRQAQTVLNNVKSTDQGQSN